MWTQKVHAEVVDKSISLIRVLQEPGDVHPSDIMALNSLAGALTNELYYRRIVTESHFFKERPARTPNVQVFVVTSHYYTLQVTFFFLLQSCLLEIYLFCRIWSEAF